MNSNHVQGEDATAGREVTNEASPSPIFTLFATSAHLQLAEKQIGKWKVKSGKFQSKGQQTKTGAVKNKDGANHLWPQHHNSCNPWKVALGKSRITKLLKGRNWPSKSADLLWFNARISVFRFSWNGLEWHDEKVWKVCFVRIWRGGGRPLGAGWQARVSTVIVALSAGGEIVEWNWLLLPSFVLQSPPSAASSPCSLIQVGNAMLIFWPYVWA